MIYFERLEDGSIDQATDDIHLAQRLGFYNEDNITDNWNNFIVYKGKKYLKTEINYNDYLLEEKIREFRIKREYECFPIINRGELWYSKLTESQKKELDDWYLAWLNVTETLIEPLKPEWIK